jgi:DNA-binding beta-propeller fold protein YncE
MAPLAMSANTIFWTSPYSSPNRIFFANLDGSSGSPGTLPTTGATVNTPWEPAPDPAAGKIYWANYSGNKISWANLDGSGGGDLNTGSATVSGPDGAVVDHAAGKIYWPNYSGNKISWANLDGSGGGDLNTGSATVSGPIGVAIDTAAGKIYWANYSGNKISFAKLDGSGGGDLNIVGTTVSSPWGVTIDSALGKIYWGNFTTDALDYANLDGTGGGVLSTPGAAQSGPMPGAVDPTTGRIYWANWNAGTIVFGKSDGSFGGGTLYSTSQPAMPAILRSPTGTGAPSITGASTVGSTLSCSQGSWAPDLLGELLYRAPQGIGHQWSLNGADLAGAVQGSITASTPGDYRCKVTATNFAGSTAQESAPFTVSAPVVSALPAPSIANLPAPNTKISKAKINSKKHMATFKFKATGSSTGFQCALLKKHKKAKFSQCSSPKTYKRLRRGKYTFEVRAAGAGGVDPTPVKKTFKI